MSVEQSRWEGSPAFNLNCDHDPTITNIELREGITSYICEYRLKEKRHSYSLVFSGDSQYGWRLRDTNRAEPMSIKARRAIETRRLEEEPTRREEAELSGIRCLEDQLRFANMGEMVIWASPPGPKEQGYGEYGFFYVGLIGSNGQVSMAANRVEHPSLGQFNEAFKRITNGKINYETAEGFLENPRVVRGLNLTTVDRVLGDVFSFRDDEKHQQIVKKVLAKMEFMIDEFVSLLRHGTKEEKEKAFYALQNYALKLKQEYESFGIGNITYFDDYRDVRLGEILDAHGYEPPGVGGSCGGSSRKKSNSLLSLGVELDNYLNNEDDYGSREFKCPHADCGKTNRRPHNQLIATCQHCGKSVRC